MTRLRLKDMDQYLAEYQLYGEVFSKQLYIPEMWQEQTGCEISDYKSYINCCMNRLYDFKTWFEHSYAEAYPEEWSDLSGYKFSVDIFSA